jgi:hypothetical protein
VNQLKATKDTVRASSGHQNQSKFHDVALRWHRHISVSLQNDGKALLTPITSELARNLEVLAHPGISSSNYLPTFKICVTDFRLLSSVLHRSSKNSIRFGMIKG